jgi:hypothetical protein
MTHTEQQRAALLTALASKKLQGADAAAAVRIIKNARAGRFLKGWEDEAVEIIDRANRGDAKLRKELGFS